jgi:hypothetical protein
LKILILIFYVYTINQILEIVGSSSGNRCGLVWRRQQRWRLPRDLWRQEKAKVWFGLESENKYMLNLMISAWHWFGNGTQMPLTSSSLAPGESKGE